MNAIHLYRIAHALHRRRVPILPRLMQYVIFLLYNSYVPCTARIGPGTVFAYGAIGVVLHSNAEIGRDCVIGQGVTIGAAEGFASKRPNPCPVIGNAVYLAAGVRVLGDIRIGNQVIVGANAVVLNDVADHSIVVGAPARVVGRTAEEYAAIDKLGA